MSTAQTVPLDVMHGGGELLKSTPAMFDAEGISVEQHFATSADGTKIPYFQVGRPGAKATPTLLYGYGGFQQSMLPGCVFSARSVCRRFFERGLKYSL